MKLGIFGGTFDPPHVGHLIVAQDALLRLELERVLFVPAATPPHKMQRAVSPAEVRLALLERAIGDDARFEIADLELRRAGPSYTVDTLRELRKSRPAAELYFLVGVDQFRELSTWRAPEEVARLARLVVLSRGESDIAGLAGPPHLPLTVSRVDVSSTEIRRRVAAGEPIRYLVPPGVEEMIRARGLYR